MESRDERESAAESRSHGRRHFRINWSLLLLLGVQAPCSGAAVGSGQIEIHGPSDPALQQGVSAAVRDADAKLADEGCRQILADFRDASGRTIQENLSSLGLSAQSYLSLILFYNGHGHSRCDSRGTLASTSPGSRVVYICSAQFLERQHRDPGLAAALIIHEELHSLGLGENPPSSVEITARVVERCGK